MTRPALSAFFICIVFWSSAQPRHVSLGVFTGLTAPYTWDEGIYSDSRYKARYEVKFSPVGIAYGIDYEGFGFMVSPSLITIGQNYNVINTVGGHEGVRKITMKYLHIPLTLKLHVIDLAFFKVSLVAGAGVGYLLNGRETVSHQAAKYRFPAAVYPILPESYAIEYDGVLAPKVNGLQMLEKKDFNSFQIFGSFGFRSDWDITEAWRVSFDMRANYGVLETRTDTYLSRVEQNQTLYDYPGKRREIFAHLNIGISRYIEVDKEKERKTKSFKKFKPQKTSPIRSPRKQRG